jgi:hypothetical protein
MQRMYANIKLPVEVYTDGKFKMLYEQMQISMITELPPELNEEIKEEVMERLQEPEPEPEPEPELNKEIMERLQEPEPDLKIYASDYPFHRNKTRWNTTFRKNQKKNQLTKKNYIDISTQHPIFSSNN